VLGLITAVGLTKHKHHSATSNKILLSVVQQETMKSETTSVINVFRSPFVCYVKYLTSPNEKCDEHSISTQRAKRKSQQIIAEIRNQGVKLAHYSIRCRTKTGKVTDNCWSEYFTVTTGNINNAAQDCPTKTEQRVIP
jgi:hypothetical protein